ncbi:MAG TPA: CoA transferase [Gemmatimonadaceae bacterium]|nr:CoA transferase [Gemmatimonadaceae bacterium]
MNESGSTLPLTGVKVLDLTRVLAGPLCTMALGDLGADVIKVERPGVGDDTRSWGGPTPLESPYFTSINRNKLSLAADFDSGEGRAQILALVAEADVVVDNFLPAVLAKRGIDPDDLVKAFPSLVWCTITGFGAGNPRPGYDFVTQAECGWMAITGEPDGEPLKVGVALADIVAGKDAAIAILAALVGRAAGRPVGRRIVISLADSARAALVNVAQNAVASGKEPKRWGNAHPNIVPYQLFHAADQAIVLAVGSDSQWASCVRVLGLDDLAGDASLARNPGRLAARERIVSRIEEVMRTKPAGYWMERLRAAGVPAGIVKSVLQALEDTSASPIMGVPSSVGGRWRLAPPKLDEHGPLIRRVGWRVFEQIGGTQGS